MKTVAVLALLALVSVSGLVLAGEPPAAPAPVKADTRVGVYIFPGWYRDAGTTDYDYRTHNEDSEWRQVADVASPRPVLGFYDDSLPEVNDWHIAWALEAGISWFAFDWYWNAGEKRLERTLERGFLNASRNEEMEFCIHWCNHGLDWKRPLDFSPDALEEVIRYCARTYFGRPNYMKIGNRPVFMVWDIKAVLEQTGGQEGFRDRVLPRLNTICRDMGLGDLFLIWVDNNPRRLADVRIGDAVTGYSYAGLTTVSSFAQPGSAPYSELVEALPGEWERIRTECALPFLVSTQSGWDNTPRAIQYGGGRSRWVRTGNTPELFEQTLRDGKRVVRPELDLFLIEAWNEWGEGSFIEPGDRYGFRQLEAIRRVFAPGAPAPTWLRPMARQVEAYSVLKGAELTAARAREARPDPPPPSPNDVATVTIDPEVSADPVGAPVDLGDPPLFARTPVSGGLEKIGTRDGAGVFRVIGADPFILARGDWGPFSRVGAVAVRFALPKGGGGAQLFWETSAVPMSEAASRRFAAPADGQMHTCVITFNPEVPRPGVLTAIRFDVPDLTGEDREVRVEWIRPLIGVSEFETVYESGLMRGNEPAKRIDADIRGASELRLIVSDGGDGGAWDHADWGDAQLIAPDGAATYADDLTPVSALQGYGELGRARNLEGNPLRIGDRAFAHGLGTSHDSTVIYDLGGRYDRFRAWVGLDAVVGDHGTVSFHVVVRRPRSAPATEPRRRGPPTH